MVEIDKEKDVYLFLHGRMDLHQKSIDALTAIGVAKEKIIMAMPNKVELIKFSDEEFGDFISGVIADL